MIRVKKMDRLFADRRDAGMNLAAKLSHYSDRNDLVVLALPRGACRWPTKSRKN
jgi:predicted phosphoribosyltransferase